MNFEASSRRTWSLSAGVLGDIGVTYALLAGVTGAGAVAAARVAAPIGEGRGIGWLALVWTVSAAMAVPVAVVNSLLFHRLSLFIHAATHWELAPSKLTSDRLFRWLVAWFLGTDLDAHRTRHFAHHRKLGEPDDPEDLYSAPFTRARVVAMLTKREAFGKPVSAGEPAPARNPFQPLSKGIHLAIVGVLCWVRDPGFAFVAWVVPAMIGFPLVSYIRDYCEHHPLPGEPAAIARNFRGGVDAFFFGAAGFRWHHSHHERPGVHYKRLAAEPASATNAGTYAGMFVRLVRADRRARTARAPETGHA